MVARATGDGPGLVAREAATALGAFADDPSALVTACRRLVDRQPTVAPVWWLAARVLSAADAGGEAWRAAELLWGDPTSKALAAALPDGCRVTVLGRPEQVAPALRRRGDAEALVVDVRGEGRGLVSELRRGGNDVHLVDESGLGAAVVASSLVLLEASAVGGKPGAYGMVAQSGSRAAAAVARSAGVPVWVVAGVGRALPEPLWNALVRRVAADPAPWAADVERVPLEPTDRVAGPEGIGAPAEAVAAADCPVAPELLGRGEG
jgi:hypothetical protein